MARISNGWRGLALELLVVFVGVLIALGVDSRWQAHQDLARVESYLQAIEADMVEVTQRVDSVLTDTRGTFDKKGAYLKLLASSDPPPDTVVTRDNSWPGPLRLPLGTLQAFVETGDVNLVRDPGLRAHIVSALSRLQQAEDELARNSDMAYENWVRMATLAQEVAMRNGRDSPVLSIAEARREPGIRSANGIHYAILRQMIGNLEELLAISNDLRTALHSS